ncbi:uncharacterized protein JN550_011263 [Neoarthrinium moseri]|uniref:uncharacterized protein n=1 Tax=Neoarthrinium moseri TaxID=1658444 RepID=UPI001FDC6DFF|nr:uncharacterized protein JN550_011263 [Neoarthrinium moseri]KAI1860801.1 hypothetical protein JN550_011263 [Neoarthrinium moseri]
MGSVSVASFNAPTDERQDVGATNIVAVDYPPTINTASIDAIAVARSIVAEFNEIIKSKDYKALGDLFLDDSYWRDHLCLSWDFHTLKGRNRISSFLETATKAPHIDIDETEAHRSPQVANVDVYGHVKCVTTFLKVTTDVGSGQGVLRLTKRNEDWKILTLFTTLQKLDGHEEPRGSRRPTGHEGGRNGKNWHETRTDDRTYHEKEPTVLVIGAGQGGLTVAARLKMLGVNTLVVDREGRVGDNWRNRYRRLVLHDPVWFDHLPYMKFPDYWPVFTPKDKLAEWFESYVSTLELNVWTQTELVSSSWDEGKGQWTVTLERQSNGEKATHTFHPRHIIQATGHSGKKNFPTIKGAESFKGRLCHSSEFPGATPDSHGKHAIVVGCCNSGHDIAQDLYEHGYHTTMVQRSSTCVVSSESITDIALKGLYSEGSVPVDDADVLMWSLPSELAKRQQIQVCDLQNDNDRKTLEGLQSVGFRVDKGPNGAGLFYKYLQRGGGYYIDVGCSQLIIDGKIKIKQGQEVEEVLPHGLKFTDGSQLEADEIIFATGYENMRTQARIIFGDNVADRLNDVWGFDEEGEFRTIWRRSGHPGFWFMGGNLALSRYYSLLLALQIKALEEGLATYGSTS